MRDDKNFLSEGVREQVIVKKKLADGMPQDTVSPEILAIKDKMKDALVPLEIKITKSKDSEKNKSRFLLFCKQNLRIYNNIDEYIKDAPTLEVSSAKLAKEIDLLINQAITNIVTTDFMEMSPPTQVADGSILDMLQADQTRIFQSDDASSLFH